MSMMRIQGRAEHSETSALVLAYACHNDNNNNNYINYLKF